MVRYSCSKNKFLKTDLNGSYFFKTHKIIKQFEKFVFSPGKMTIQRKHFIFFLNPVIGTYNYLRLHYNIFQFKIKRITIFNGMIWIRNSRLTGKNTAGLTSFVRINLTYIQLNWLFKYTRFTKSKVLVWSHIRVLWVFKVRNRYLQI